MSVALQGTILSGEKNLYLILIISLRVLVARAGRLRKSRGTVQSANTVHGVSPSLAWASHADGRSAPGSHPIKIIMERIVCADGGLQELMAPPLRVNII